MPDTTTKTRRLTYSPAETLSINIERLEAEAVRLRPRVTRLAAVEAELLAYKGALALLEGAPQTLVLPLEDGSRSEAR